MSGEGTGYADGRLSGFTSLPRTSRPYLYEGKDISSDPVKYKMNHGKRGIALIISNQKFNTANLGKRAGSKTDAKRMKETLVNLGFDVVFAKDLKADKLEELLRSKASADIDHSDRDCFLCVIMTHGKEDHIYGTDGGEISLQTVMSMFNGQNCPSLAGKPKIFIFNACQGPKRDEGHHAVDFECADAYESEEEEEDQDDADFTEHLPHELDFLYIHSTMHGYTSYRDTKKGSIFIQTLCDVLDHYGGQMEICKILTIVNNTVAIEFESKGKVPDDNGKKQCPCYRSLLTKQLYLTQKSPE